ncbi:helix-turn-helix domain-containing protein [Streptomyces sp. NBC_01433]|uniref:IclR family transcriptional regulator domain-containing protein n=1 Tax=Streptomyces sp. NBC_01433 TaxID=2903864 RepID=UPI002258A9D5|nr:IclR family transcriptional regulator C-terminal domain-containing protein [Streptomyces sp. NBC_01433]MCX4679452.1 helix-turn-helix domain-containing protein [Streptomyces sp. NBC_01433]
MDSSIDQPFVADDRLTAWHQPYNFARRILFRYTNVAERRRRFTMQSRRTDADNKEEFVSSLARGLAVIRAFGPDRPQMTLTEVASATGLSPAVARRFLLTLVRLRYAAHDGKHFMLRPSILELGAGYLSSVNIAQIAQPQLQTLRDNVGDATSLAVLDGDDIIQVCYVPARRLYRFTVTNGTREAAYTSAAGRAMLAHLDAHAIDEFLSRVRLEARTDRTETSPTKFRAVLADVREHGYAVVVDEFEYGITSIAVPIFDGTTVIAAAACVASSGYLTEDELVSTRLPELRNATERIAEELARFPAFAQSVRWA